jgi:hypothetical protein
VDNSLVLHEYAILVLIATKASKRTPSGEVKLFTALGGRQFRYFLILPVQGTLPKTIHMAALEKIVILGNVLAVRIEKVTISITILGTKWLLTKLEIYIQAF